MRTSTDYAIIAACKQKIVGLLGKKVTKGLCVMAKKQKTLEELIKLLHEHVELSVVGQTVNPQWIKIIPVDPPVDGVSWKVSHSGEAGDFSHAIDRATKELQIHYDLKE